MQVFNRRRLLKERSASQDVTGMTKNFAPPHFSDQSYAYEHGNRSEYISAESFVRLKHTCLELRLADADRAIVVNAMWQIGASPKSRNRHAVAVSCRQRDAQLHTTYCGVHELNPLRTTSACGNGIEQSRLSRC